MLEPVVLTLIERVLSAYVSDLLGRRTRRRDREELLSLIRTEFRHRDLMVDEIAALKLAQRELELIVKNVPALRWSGDGLDITQPTIARRLLRRPGTVVLGELRAAVEARRSELGLPATESPVEDRAALLSEDVEMAVARSVEAATPTRRDPSTMDGIAGGQWRDAVNSLRADVLRERRRRRNEKE